MTQFSPLTTLEIGEFRPNTFYLNLDSNNDGLTDIVEIWQGLDSSANATTWLGDGNGRFDNEIATINFLGGFSADRTYLSLDGNNDGLTDIVEIWQGIDGTANATTWFNDGNGRFRNEIVTLDFGYFSTNRTYLSLDGNNDRLTDIVEIWQGIDGSANATIWFNDGNGRFGLFGNRSNTWKFGEFRPDSSYLALEANSDNRTDLVQVWQDLDGSARATTWINSQNFEQFLEALGELRSGKLSGDPQQYFLQNEQTNAIGKYQFSETLMQDLGYYNDQDVLDNLWSGTWTNKNGVTDLDSLKQKSAVQETAIRESLQQNYDALNSQLNLDVYLSAPNNQGVKTVQYYQLNEDRTDFLRDEQNNLIVTTQNIDLSLSGILAGTYLKDSFSISKVLMQLNNQSYVDFTADAEFNLEYYKNYLFDRTNTSIFQYFNDFGEYDVTTEDFIFSNYGDSTNFVLYGTFNDNSIDAGEGNDSIMGGFGNDLLAGENGNDLIIGEQGNDTLIGSLGNDNLTGGSGTDKFRFNSFNEGSDTITDFNPTDGDKIEVPEFSFGQVLLYDDPETRAIQDSIFEVGSSATNADTRFIYNSSTQQLFYDRDGNASNFDPVALATFEGEINLTVDDIVVV